MKHLKQASETLAKTPEKPFENHCKYMQHPDETLAKHTYETHFKHMLATCMYMQHRDLLLQHPDKKTCNICLK
jgi:hypothetical protein